MNTTEFFGTEKVSRILFKLAPPVMLAQLIQALYNIIDSLFIGRYSDTSLTALSIIYPIQLLMIALAVGTGVGINTAMASKLGSGQKQQADEFAGVGTPVAVVPVCCLLLAFNADIRKDVLKFRVSHSECDTVWQDRLCFQFRFVSGKYLDKDSAGKRGYENTHDCTNAGCSHQYYS